MELPNTFHRNKGLTVIEIIIAISLLSFIAALGLLLSFDFFKSYSLDSEREAIVSVLQRARSESINNINQVRHGVHFEAAGNNIRYIIFDCPASNPCNYVYSPAYSITTSSYHFSISSPALPFDVVFDQLTGNSSDLVIKITDVADTYKIEINSEGRINWERVNQ